MSKGKVRMSFLFDIQYFIINGNLQHFYSYIAL